MSRGVFKVSLITPEGVVFEGEARSAVIPAHDGQRGILPSHAPLICKLEPGRFRLHTPEGIRTWFVDGGVAHIRDDHVSVLTDLALRPEELDRQHAMDLLEQARQMSVEDEEGRRHRDQIMASARAQLRMIG